MNTASILAEVGKLPVEAQVGLVHRIWDNIAESNVPLELTEDQKAELDRRSAELEANPEMAIPWETVKRTLEDRHRE